MKIKLIMISGCQMAVEIHPWDTVVVSVSRIDDMSAHIATAAEEQSAVAETMNSNIDHVNTMASKTLKLPGKLARLARSWNPWPRICGVWCSILMCGPYESGVSVVFRSQEQIVTANRYHTYWCPLVYTVAIPLFCFLLVASR